MPPKSIKVKTLTRSQSKEQGLNFEWSRELGGTVELTTRDVESSERAIRHHGNPEQPSDETPETSVSVEIEVEESGSDSAGENSSDRPENESAGSEFDWDGHQEPLTGPLASTETADSILSRHGIEDLLGSDEDIDDQVYFEKHYPAKSWSVSVNRLDVIDPRNLSPERRPAAENAGEAQELEDSIAEITESLVDAVFIMNEDQYKVRCRHFNKLVRKVEDHIGNFTARNVSQRNKHEVGLRLEDVRTA